LTLTFFDRYSQVTLYLSDAETLAMASNFYYLTTSWIGFPMRFKFLRVKMLFQRVKRECRDGNEGCSYHGHL